MEARITLSKTTTKQLAEIEQRARRGGNYRLLRRLAGLRQLVEGARVQFVATTFGLAEQTIRNWRNAFISRGIASLHYKKPPGRPAKLSKSQRRELKQIIEAGPQEAGYASACWTSLMIQELIAKHFHVIYNRHYVCELLGQLGLSYQKAKFVSDHLNEEARPNNKSDSQICDVVLQESCSPDFSVVDIPLIFYLDEFEPDNPIGSKRKTHKLTVI